MPGLHSSDVINKVPSLAETLLNAADPEQTPLLSRVRKARMRLTQFDHKVYLELKNVRRTGGATDGQDVTEYEGGGPRREFSVRAQEFRRTPKVGQQTQRVIEDTAITDQFARLKLRLGKEIWKDIETKMLSDDSSAPDEGIPDRGSRMAGLGYLLSVAATTMGDNPIPTDVRIPTGQVISGVMSTIGEGTLTDAMEARRQAVGHSAELVLFAGTKVQRKFDDFENYYPDKASHTVTLRTLDTTKEKTIRRGIRFYEGSFGTVEVVIDDFMPDANRGYLLDLDEPDGIQIIPFDKMATFMDIPNLGGGPRGLLTVTMAYSPGDPRSHIKFVAS